MLVLLYNNNKKKVPWKVAGHFSPTVSLTGFNLTNTVLESQFKQTLYCVWLLKVKGEGIKETAKHAFLNNYSMNFKWLLENIKLTLTLDSINKPSLTWWSIHISHNQFIWGGWLRAWNSFWVVAVDTVSNINVKWAPLCTLPSRELQ